MSSTSLILSTCRDSYFIHSTNHYLWSGHSLTFWHFSSVRVVQLFDVYSTHLSSIALASNKRSPVSLYIQHPALGLSFFLVVMFLMALCSSLDLCCFSHSSVSSHWFDHHNSFASVHFLYYFLTHPSVQEFHLLSSPLTFALLVLVLLHLHFLLSFV